MKPNYIVRVGEPISLSLIAVEGDITNVTSVEAKLKLSGPNNTIPNPTAPSIANFNVTTVNLPALGWNLNIPGSITADLKPGVYVTNAKLNLVSGGPLKTEHIFIEVKGSVS